MVSMALNESRYPISKCMVSMALNESRYPISKCMVSMALNESYELHHNFPKIAEESRFTFNLHKNKGYIDWNKIRQIDIENLIRDRRFGLIEQHVGEIVGCALELEFDVRILDEGVVKLFRLAQLAVEYQQFCRRYLDHSVYVLREEIMAVTQELNILKKEIRDKEDELRKVKKKCRSNIRPLPYNSNENIANMILKTLSCRADVFPPAPLIDSSHQYNKCSFCEKVFMNQLYLKSHINRRHGHLAAERDIPDENQKNQDSDNKKLSDEVMHLKAKLQEMESVLENKIENEKIQAESSENNAVNAVQTEKTNQVPHTTVMKSVEVSTNNDDYYISQIEKWKLEEREKYDKELKELKQQIVDTVNAIREQKEESTKSNELQQLHDIIKEQGNHISALKQELTRQNLKTEATNVNKASEIEAEMRSWMQKTEIQSKRLDNLMNSLNEMTKEAKEARALAEAESARAAKLQMLLDINQANKESANNVQQNVKIQTHQDDNKNVKELPKRAVPKKDSQLLEELQQKAKELLTVESSVTSDESSAESSDDLPVNFVTHKRNLKSKETDPTLQHTRQKIVNGVTEDHNKEMTVQMKNNRGKPRKQNTKSHLKISSPKRPAITSSPIRLVRCKITEEVNNRLVDIGVDPLKNGLNQGVYNKQRNQLQKHQMTKSKTNQDYEKTRHAILAYLDTRLANHEYAKRTNLFPNKNGFISNVISTVKSKTLSLVKRNGPSKGVEKVNITKRALQVARTSTSTSSESESPDRQAITKKEIKKCKKLSDYRPDIVSRDKYTSESPLTSIVQPVKESKSIENLIKSPVRKPATINQNTNLRQLDLDDLDLTPPPFKSSPIEVKVNGPVNDNGIQESDTSEEIDLEANPPEPLKKNISEDNIHLKLKQAKGVLKHASSTSSLNKKKVIFDMDAIQMKSVSASPSQSTSVGDSEQYELGLVNLDDEWDISSIHESLKITNIKPAQHRTSPKIAELKESIESQLARRSEIMSTAPIGGIDVARGLGGSNTSLGSSLLDDDQLPVAAPRNIAFKNTPATLSHNAQEKDDSDLDVSEYSLEDMFKK